VSESPAARYDCLIVGGGPAGLSAALILGRCRRRVLVCDAGMPRNAKAQSIHGVLTRDGLAPAAFLHLAREELARYTTVEFRRTEVTAARCAVDGFEIRCRDGCSFEGRTLLLATGVVDDLPPIEGLFDFYGTSVHHCPYCDAWEWRDRALAVYGRGESAAGLALTLTLWSADIVLCTDGPSKLSTASRRRLARHGIVLRTDPVLRLEGHDGHLERIVFAAGASLARQALFFLSGQYQRSPLPQQLGCRFTSKGAVATARSEATQVPGLYVAGDASKDVQFVSVAAAEGAEAAVAINKMLLKADLRLQ
jgi:thioredoxin reductase